MTNRHTFDGGAVREKEKEIEEEEEEEEEEEWEEQGEELLLAREDDMRDCNACETLKQRMKTRIKGKCGQLEMKAGRGQGCEVLAGRAGSRMKGGMQEV